MFRFCTSSSSGISGVGQKRYATSLHVYITSLTSKMQTTVMFILKFSNKKTHVCLEYDMRFISSKPRVTYVQEKSSS